MNGFFNIIPLHKAIAFEDGFAILEGSQREVGSSGSQINISNSFKHHEDLQAIPTETTTISSFACKHLLPKYIKIDIDGLEHIVIHGIDLSNPKLKSVLVEINQYSEKIKAEFINNDFTYEKEPLNYLQNHSRVRRAKEGINAENVIFTRR